MTIQKNDSFTAPKHGDTKTIMVSESPCFLCFLDKHFLSFLCSARIPFAFPAPAILYFRFNNLFAFASVTAITSSEVIPLISASALAT